MQIQERELSSMRLFYTKEQDEWLREFYPTMSLEKVVNEFNIRFNQKRTKQAILTHCNRGLGLKNEARYYTPDQIEWFKSFFPTHTTKETALAFKSTFCEEITEGAVHTLVHKRLHLHNNTKNFYSKEEDEWLRENYQVDEPRSETIRKFNERFSQNRSEQSITAYCKEKGYASKPSRRFKEGNVTWNTGMSKEEYKSHFSEQSFQSMTNTAKKNFPHSNIREEYEKQNGPIPDGYVLSERTPGSGEYILIRHDIYKNLFYHKVVGQGKLTEAMSDYLEVKKELDRLTKE